MNNTDNCKPKADCSGRREFLVKAALMAGGIVLTLSAPSVGLAMPFEDVVVPIDDKSPLNKVGGTATVDSSAGKIIILRTGDAAFVALSAKCTHKGGPIKYDAEAKQFFCPWHGSKYNNEGKATDGPAPSPLKSYTATGTATSVTVNVS